MSCRIRFTALMVIMLCACLGAAVGAAPPEIAHIQPDYAGNQFDWPINPPHIITGEGLDTPGLEIYAWNLQPLPSVAEEAAKLLGTDKEPRLPAEPPLNEAGRNSQGLKAGAPNWDLIQKITPLSVEPQIIMASLCSASAQSQNTAIWLKNRDGFSKPYLINTPRPKWLSEESLQQGETLRLFGLGIRLRNKPTLLAFRRGTTTRLIKYVEPSYHLDSQDTSLVEVVIPMDMEPGEYTVYIHNGMGGQFGWARAGVLKVELRRKAEEKIFCVRDYGALADGRANDTAAIRKAIEAARADTPSLTADTPPAVVYFAPGTYRVDESLLVPSGVKLRGGGMENTIIEGFGFDPNVAPPDGRRTWNSDKPRPCSVVLLQPYTGMERIMIRGETAGGTVGQTVQVVTGDERTPSLPHGAVYGRVKVREVQVRGHLGTVTSYTPRRIAYGIEVRDSIFHGSLSIFALLIRGDYVNNRFYRGYIASCGNYDCLIERNIMSEGPERFVFMIPMRNTYVRYNEIYNYGTQGVGQWGAQEAYLNHGGAKKYVGKASSAGPDTLTDKRQAWQNGELSQGTVWHMSASSTVLITAGRGFGQYRHVTANGRDTMTVDRPWNVVPDGTSEYVVGNFIVDSVWYANYLDGLGEFSMGNDQINVVIDKHRDNHAGGIICDGDDGAGDQQPRLAWYSLLVNCHMEGSTIQLRSGEDRKRPIVGPVFFGNSVVGNNIVRPQFRAPSALHTMPTAGIGFVDPFFGAGSVPSGRTSHTIIAGNTIAGSDVGILVRDYARKTVIIGNDFQQVSRPILDAGAGSLQRSNRQTAFSDTEVGKAASLKLPDLDRPDHFKDRELPPVKYRYSEAAVPLPPSFFAADFLRTTIPQYTYIPADVESAKVQDECAGNLRKLYGILLAYEKKNGSLPKAAFYPEKPLTDADSLMVLLGNEARPFLRCPAAGPDFDKLGWPNYIWNDELSGKKLADVKDRKGTWLLMDFSAPHVWGVGKKFMGHRGGVNVLYADGSVQWLDASVIKERFNWAKSSG